MYTFMIKCLVILINLFCNYKNVFILKIIDLLNKAIVPLWIIVGFFFLNVFMGCCLICHPDRHEYLKEMDASLSKKGDVEMNY